jgi:L-iditol 2-dehydrogenase
VHASSDRWASDVREGDRLELIIEAIGHQDGTVNDAIHAVANGG